MKDRSAGNEGRPLPDDWLEAADAYHRPPEPPRAEMWAAIRDGMDGTAPLSLDEARERRARRRVALRWWAPAVAAAAVLVVGIGIGRLTAPVGVGGPDSGMSTSADASAASAEGPAASGTATDVSPAVRTVALEHLGRSESLLTLVQVDARTGRVGGDVGAWGRGLLQETRLLLDSPAADDPALRDLLEDLELILAQVALLEGSEVVGDRLRAELDIIARGLDERDVLSRIQAVLPAGSAMGMTGT